MKKNLALISTIIFSLSLAGCTSKQNKVSTPSKPNTKVEKKIYENTTSSKPTVNNPKETTNTKNLKHNN